VISRKHRLTHLTTVSRSTAVTPDFLITRIAIV
jgi:hypothetical protein